MDLRQLTALVAVAEVGSVTKAARLLHLVQPAVTRQIRALEDELGVPLFDRTPQGMLLTPDGTALAERARRALNELDRARAEIARDTGEVGGLVTVGMLESTIELLVSPLLEAIAARHPRIRLRIVTAYSGHLRQWLDSGEIDVSVLYNLSDNPTLTVLPVLLERLWAVALPAAQLAADRPVTWVQALSHPVVLPVPGHGLRTLIEQARAELPPITPNVVAEVDSMFVQKNLVAAGHGWTVLPAAGVAVDVAAGVFSAAPLVEPDVGRALVIGYPRSARASRPVRAVATALVGLARDLVRTHDWPSAELSAAADN